MKMVKKKVLRNSLNYQRVPLVDDEEFSDLQFEKPNRKIPWKSIIFALVLMIGGSILIIVGAMLVSGRIDAMYGDRTWPLLLLGSIMFIPGSYHVRIAYYAYNNVPGYSFDEIPEFE